MSEVLVGQATVNADDLRKAIRFAHQATQRRNIIPVLSTVLMRFTKTDLTVTGTDLDIECEMTVPAEASRAFSFCIGPLALAAVASFGSGGSVEIKKIDEASHPKDGLPGTFSKLLVASSDVKATFTQLFDVADFPLMDPKALLHGGGTLASSASVSEALLAKMLADVMPCISTEETPYYLNGAYLHAKEDGYLRAVATDGHRLALRKSEAPWSDLDGIVPTKHAMIIAANLKPQGNGEVLVVGSKLFRRVSMVGGDWTITHKLIDGTFPDYTRVIPNPKGETSVPLSWEQVRRFGAAVTERSHAISIDPEAGTISMRSVDLGVELSTPLHGAVGKRFGLNYRYLSDILRRRGTVRLESSGPGDPVIAHTEDPDLTLVVMPMRL